MTNKRQEVQSLATISIIENDYNLALDISPRVGKSKILIDAIRDKKDWDICISSPYEAIKKNWDKEITHWKLGFKPKLICHRSLKKIPEGLDLLVIDEFQTLSEANCKIILDKHPKRIVCLSGTVNYETELRIRNYLKIQVKYRYTIEQAISDGIIAPFNVKVIRCELDNKNRNVLSGTVKNVVYRTEKGHYDYLTKAYIEFRDRAIDDSYFYNIKMKLAAERQRFVSKAETKKVLTKNILAKLKRAMVFTLTTEQADDFCDSYHSKNKSLDNLQKFIEEYIDKLAVVNMVNMGITIPNLKRAIIHQIQSNSEMTLQKILRMCNLDDGLEACIYITCYKNTIDEEWVKSALQGVNSERIEYIDYVDLEIDKVIY